MLSEAHRRRLRRFTYFLETIYVYHLKSLKHVLKRKKRAPHFFILSSTHGACMYGIIELWNLQIIEHTRILST